MKKTAIFTFFNLLIGVTILSCKDVQRKEENFSNELKSTSWIVHEGGLVNIDGEKNYHLSKRNDTALIFNFHAIDFLDEEKFKSYDSWECGNDCFTEIYGRYYFKEVNQIKMEVDSITQSGTCEASTQIFIPSKAMSFDIVKNGDQLSLIRK